MSDGDLVVFSLEPWDEVWRRNQYLVEGVLRTHSGLRVLFVEPPTDPLHALRGGSAPRTGRGLRPGPPLTGIATDRLWLLQPTKLLPRRIDAHADTRIARAVVRAADRLRMRTPALWVNDSSAAALLEIVGWPALYDVTDDWTAAHRDPAEIARLVANERKLLDRCCEVTVCSPALAERKRGAAPVTLVTNGVDVARYRTPAPRPTDLPTGRVVLYVGTVHRDRFDIEACAAAARLLARGTADMAAERRTIVLLGPAPLDDADQRTLRTAGVVLLGPRPFDAVPAYLQHSDVLVVPHVVDAFTDSLDPIKLYEYRAVGKPVVSTPVSGFRDAADGSVTIATADAFPAAVARVLASTLAGAGLGPLKGEVPTWAEQVAQFGAVLDRVQRQAPTPR